MSEEGLAAVIAAATAGSGALPPLPAPAGAGAGTVIEFGMHAFTVRRWASQTLPAPCAAGATDGMAMRCWHFDALLAMLLLPLCMCLRLQVGSAVLSLLRWVSELRERLPREPSKELRHSVCLVLNKGKPRWVGASCYLVPCH